MFVTLFELNRKPGIGYDIFWRHVGTDENDFLVAKTWTMVDSLQGGGGDDTLRADDDYAFILGQFGVTK